MCVFIEEKQLFLWILKFLMIPNSEILCRTCDFSAKEAIVTIRNMYVFFNLDLKIAIFKKVYIIFNWYEETKLCFNLDCDIIKKCV